MRSAAVMFHDRRSGVLLQDENGFHFKYDTGYLNSSDPSPVSKTLPLQQEEFQSNILFPFFDGLIPEGWLLEVAEDNWKLDPRDRMGLLMSCCKDCIGAVSIIPQTEADHE